MDNEKDKIKKRAVGTYEWRGKSSVRLRVRYGRDPETDEPIRYETTVRKIKQGDEKAAEKALALFISEIEKGEYAKPIKMTINQLAERFLRDSPEIGGTTRNSYKGYLDNYILPALGHKKIDKVTRSNLYDYYNNLKEDGIRKDGKPGGFSPATIQKHHNILSAMFTFAVDNLAVLKKNPCIGLKPVKIPKRKQKASLDKISARNLLRALEKESLKYKVIAIIASCTGMRRGEILGIGDSTLDLENCVIKITRASTHIPGEGIFIDDPKTDTSYRYIPFPRSIVPLLQEMIAARNKQREKCGHKWQSKILIYGELVDNDLLVTQWNGKPMHPNSIDTWFNKFRNDNGIPDTFKFHGLRHTNIHLLLKAGTDLGTVKDNSGHAAVTTTIDYDDPDAEVLRGVSNTINDALELEKIVPNLLGKPTNIYRKKDLEKHEETTSE